MTITKIKYIIEARDGEEELFVAIPADEEHKEQLLQAIKEGRVEKSDLEQAIENILSEKKGNIKDKSFESVIKRLDFLNDNSKNRTEFYQSAIELLQTLLNAKYVGLHFTDTKYLGIMPESDEFKEFTFKTNYCVGDSESKSKIDLLKSSGDLNLYGEINEEIVPDAVLNSGSMTKRILKPNEEEVARLEVYGIGINEKEANERINNFIKIIDSIIKADIKPHKALFRYKQLEERMQKNTDDGVISLGPEDEVLGRGYQPNSKFEKNILQFNEIYNNYRKRFRGEYKMFDPEDVFTNEKGKDGDFVKMVSMLTHAAIEEYGVERLRNGENTKEAMMFISMYFLTPKYGTEKLKKEKNLTKITNALAVFVENLIEKKKINIPSGTTASEIIRLCKEINDVKDKGIHDEADLLEAIIKYSDQVLDTPYSEPHKVKDALDSISVDGYDKEATLIGRIVMTGGKYI